jgi:hypothetical protein
MRPIRSLPLLATNILWSVAFAQQNSPTSTEARFRPSIQQLETDHGQKRLNDAAIGWVRVFPHTYQDSMTDPPAPSAAAGSAESRWCLVSLLSDSMTRYSLSALFTLPDTQ